MQPQSSGNDARNTLSIPVSWAALSRRSASPVVRTTQKAIYCFLFFRGFSCRFSFFIPPDQYDCHRSEGYDCNSCIYADKHLCHRIHLSCIRIRNRVISAIYNRIEDILAGLAHSRYQCGRFCIGNLIRLMLHKSKHGVISVP